MPTIKPLLLAILLLLTAASADARFLLTDAHFDGRAPGSDLQRRGALFGEPVPGPHDREREVIVDLGGGDRAVELDDTQILGPSEMYWNLRNDLQVQGGVLTARVTIIPQSVGDYTVALRTADQLTDIVAVDITDGGATGRCRWRDGDDTSGTDFAAALPGWTYELRFELNLNTGLHSIWWDGSPVVTDEPHGLGAPTAAYLVIGHLDDGNAVGTFWYDLISVDWRPDDSAPYLLDADFSDKPVGAPLAFRGAFHGEPVSGSATPTVEVGLPLGNKAMVIDDNSTTGSTGVRYQFYNDVEPSDEPVSISFAVAFDELDQYDIGVRESGSSSQLFFDMDFLDSGTITFRDAAGSIAGVTATYSAGVRHLVEMTFEPVLDVYSVWFDGERLVHRRSHGITGREVGRLFFNLGFDSDLDGTMRVDRIRAHTLGQPLSAPHSAPPAAAARLLGAAPNPFNPATEVRFELALAGHATLEVLDSRGRRVRTLVDGHLAAGLHRTGWQGRDQAGRQLASGVYHLRLESAGEVVTKALTLLK